MFWSQTQLSVSSAWITNLLGAQTIAGLFQLCEPALWYNMYQATSLHCEWISGHSFKTILKLIEVTWEMRPFLEEFSGKVLLFRMPDWARMNDIDSSSITMNFKQTLGINIRSASANKRKEICCYLRKVWVPKFAPDITTCNFWTIWHRLDL